MTIAIPRNARRPWSGTAAPLRMPGSTGEHRERHAGRIVGLLALCLLLATTSACAPALIPGGVPTAAEIPALERHLAERPGDRDARVRLGAAYVEINRPQEALRVLEPVTEDGPELVGLFLRGGALESLGEYNEARLTYERLARLARDVQPALRDAAEERLPLIRRRQLEADVRASVQREAELADQDPDPVAVAVFPFVYDGANPEYSPLGRAMAELVVNDLVQVEELRVLERLRVQLLLDEMQLAEAGRVDPATAVRSGRILGAGRVVQGRLGADDEELLSVLAGLVSSRGDEPVRSVDDEDTVQAFFDLQERVTLALLQEMGIRPTPQQRERIALRPTQSLEAILLFGRALEAEDRGDYDEADRLYEEAHEADPDFTEAEERSQRARRMNQQATVTPRGYTGQVLRDEMLVPPGPRNVEQVRIGFRELDALVPGLEAHDPGSELLGTQGLGLGPALIEIILSWE